LRVKYKKNPPGADILFEKNYCVFVAGGA